MPTKRGPEADAVPSASDSICLMNESEDLACDFYERSPILKTGGYGFLVFEIGSTVFNHGDGPAKRGKAGSSKAGASGQE